MSAVAVHIEDGGDSNGSDFAYSVQLYHAFDGWQRGVPFLDYACCATFFGCLQCIVSVPSLRAQNFTRQ